MDRTLGEFALGRVLAYLRWCGLVLTPEAVRSALQVVESALSQGETDLLRRVMDDLPRRFALPVVQAPPPLPPVRRGSIGYG
ncbi:MAG: hypothetical protein B7Z66_03895 [Chromatiales bacterium 21-64-14]|nr:MAG: hypothetical protein B7Z66_03895 [Chromatiales bacterium 21-64-14]HQU14778.1 hypothetical protein [Gammaproteobacteria bacterium]